MTVATKIIQTTNGGTRTIKRTALVLFVALTTCFLGAGAAQAASALPASASVVALAVPQTAVGSVAPVAAMLPTLGVGNCGFLQTCIYLNPTDQRAVVAGAGNAVANTLCAIPGGFALCAVIRVAVEAVSRYLSIHPICATEVEIMVSPHLGIPVCT